jgi:TetR/AcrR family transcriptional repressor of nem operon
MDEATARAMDLFWLRGYEESALPELLQCMGIVRGSFYKAYGDKRSVWLAALDHYDQTVVQPVAAALTDPSRGDGLVRIAEFLDAPAAAVRCSGDRRGCFLCNAAMGTATDDTLGRERILAMVARLENSLFDALKGSNIHASASADALSAQAKQVLACYIGLRVLARADMPVEALEAAAQAQLAALAKP